MSLDEKGKIVIKYMAKGDDIDTARSAFSRLADVASRIRDLTINFNQTKGTVTISLAFEGELKAPDFAYVLRSIADSIEGASTLAHAVLVQAGEIQGEEKKEEVVTSE